jgi:poly-gamma-glutamate capsule biosynthesis protein CapA/YwtB (metallophosphatase superfamily)
MRRLGCSVVFFFSAFTPWAQDTTRLSLLFLGDIMQHDSQIAAAYQKESGTYDYSSCFRWLSPHLRSADLTIGNLELTLAGPPYKGYPQFSAPDALVRDLKKAGVDVLVAANNHSMDRGRAGVERTLDVLRAEQIPTTGTFKDSLDRTLRHPLLIEKKGFRLSLLNYTYGTNGIAVPPPVIVNRIDTVQLKQDLEAARHQQPDVIIVFFHWGAEYQSQPNGWQRELTQFCFREGVQLVIGAHPHVLQPMEWNQPANQLVAYSLGNFVSGQRPRYRDGGATLEVHLQKITADSLTQTTISEARYHLQWVHRDQRQQYYVLPAVEFVTDTILLKSATHRQALAQFVTDSQLLFKSFNQGVLSDRAQGFRVWITNDSTLQEHPVLQFYQAQFMYLGDELSWVTGEFQDIETAIQVATEIATQTHYRLAAVMRVGRRKD